MMKKIICLIFLSVLFVSLAEIASAQVPEQDPFYSIGSDFLVGKPDDNSFGYHPTAYTLFDNTHIYLDNQNDGIWDYEFIGNAGQGVTIDPPDVIVAQPGALIHSDKPVGYRQALYYRNDVISDSDCSSSGGYHINRDIRYTYVPSINSIKTDYYTYGGGWNVIAYENSMVYIDINIDDTIDQTFSISNGEIKSFIINSFARIYSENPLLVYNANTIAGIKGNDFFTSFEKVTLLIIEDGTEIKFDLNNDDTYDEVYTLNKGLYDYTLAKGAHINANKPIASFTTYRHDGRSGCGQPSGGTAWTIYHNVTLPPVKMAGSDLWVPNATYFSGSYAHYTDQYLFGLYNDFSGLYVNTIYRIDRQKENNLVADYTNTTNSNTYQKLPYHLGNMHLWSDMPVMTSEYYMAYNCYMGVANDNCEKERFYYTSTQPYSVIYATSWPNYKIMGANEIADFTVRAFNPFATTDVTNVQLKIKIPSAFSMPGGNINVVIEKRNIVNDNVISTDNTLKTPALVGDYYEFTITGSDTSLFSNLNHFEYYDLQYSVTTPTDYGTYKFPVEMTYDSDTWQK